jgi:hypothetical protein
MVKRGSLRGIFHGESHTDPSAGAYGRHADENSHEGLPTGWRAGNRSKLGCVRSTQPSDTPATQTHHIRSSAHAIFRAPAIPRTVLRGVAGAQSARGLRAENKYIETVRLRLGAGRARACVRRQARGSSPLQRKIPSCAQSRRRRETSMGVTQKRATNLLITSS